MHNAITPLLAAAMIAAGSAMCKGAEPQPKPTNVLCTAPGHEIWWRKVFGEPMAPRPQAERRKGSWATNR